MDVVQMKRIVMFTWLNKNEVDWLLRLGEIDDRKEELGISTLAEGMDRFVMTEKTIQQRDTALLGLQEEGMIMMCAEQFEYLDITELFITQRGRKVIAEAKAVLEEAELEESVVEKKLIHGEKKKEFTDKVKIFLFDLTTTVASGIFERIFSVS